MSEISSFLSEQSITSSQTSHSESLSSTINKSSSSAFSTYSWHKKPIRRQPKCFYDPSTTQHQNFSIPDKIVYYLGMNVTNGKTFQKLVKTCKYFFKVNRVIVVPRIICYAHEWYACYDEDEEYGIGFKYDQPLNFKIWIIQCIDSFAEGDASPVIPSIYKNDATIVCFGGKPLKFKDFLFLASSAKELLMWWGTRVEYENGEIVQLEDIVKNVPKIEIFEYETNFNGGSVNCNTVTKLMELEHFKNISRMKLDGVPEAFDIEEMFSYIIENRRVKVDLCYCYDTSDAFKQLVRKYAKLLRNQNGDNSRITCWGMHYFNEQNGSSSEDDSSDTIYYSFDGIDNNVASDTDEDNLLFPWNNEEGEE